MKIKLRDFYPNYKLDEVIEVSDEIHNALLKWKRNDANYLRRLYRNKAYYSLDRDDGLERMAIYKSQSPHEIIAERIAKHQLYAAIANLPGKQAKRLYAYFFLDMNMNEIADVDNVSHQTVSESINRGLIALRKELKNLL